MVGRLVEHHRPNLAPQAVGHRELARFARTWRCGFEQAIGIDSQRRDERQYASAFARVGIADRVEHHDTVARGEFLWQIKDTLRRDMRPAEHRGQQGSLADSIGAGDANLRIAWHRKMDIFENSRIAGVYRGLVEREYLGDRSGHVVDENRVPLRLAKFVLAEFL